MRLNLFVALVLVTFAGSFISLTTTENGVLVDNVAADSDAKLVNSNKNVRHLKGSRKLTEKEEWLASVEEGERGFSLTSAKSFLSRLTARVNEKNLAGAKTEKLSNAQIKAVSKGIAREVKKNPKS